MECEYSVSFSPCRFPEDPQLYKIPDERIRGCRSYLQHTANVGSSELGCFIQMGQTKIRKSMF